MAYLTCELCRNREKEGMSAGTPACADYHPINGPAPDLQKIEIAVEEPAEPKGPVVFVKAPKNKPGPKPKVQLVPEGEKPVAAVEEKAEELTDDEDFFQ